MSSSQTQKKRALLPGFGRCLNYTPVPTAPDYVGKLLKNALSVMDIEGEAKGLAYVALRGIDIALTCCSITEAR